jgi:excinuclease UvrABC helicase subunit UvrB
VSAGIPPCTLSGFFPQDYLLVLDNVNSAQIGAMYGGPLRKTVLVGAWIPSAQRPDNAR